MARAILELIGDADSLLKSFRKSSDAADRFGKDLKQLSVTAEQSARAQVDAAVKRDARLRGEIATYRQVASAAKSGSREQVAAANLATRAEERLARSLSVTSREAKEHARSVARSERAISRFSRGALAGSGAAKGLGRSLAFASGGFLATASVTGILADIIKQGTEAAATEKQLAAQFRASGLNLAEYRKQIEQATNRVSALAGIEDDELTRAFTVAFRASQDVTKSLRLQAVAADVARGRHIEVAQAMIALTRAYGGNTGSLRRLGITIPKTLKGMEAIEFVARRFAGQAAAGATSQDRFAAALANTEQIVGLQLLPSFNKLLNSASKWLSKTENQKKIQADANIVIHDTATVLGLVADAFKVAHKAAQGYSDALKKITDFSEGHGGGNTATVLKVLFKPGFGLQKLLQALEGGGGKGAGGLPPGLHGPAGTPGGAAPPGLTGPIGGKAPGPPGSLGFKARFANAEIALAQAQLTKTQADDKKILRLEAALLRERIKTLGTSRKTLAERTTLTQQLVGIEGQITSIDQQASTARKTSADKQLAARKAALAAEAKKLAGEKSTADKELSALKQRERTLSSKIKAIQANFKSALDTARQGIGDLFGGPVLNFSDEQRKAALGIPNKAADPKALVKDLNAQVRQAAVFQKNLARLSKRGASAGLVSELQAGGQANAAQVAALAGASKGTLKEFFKAFGAREKLVQHIARAQMHAQLVTLHADRVRLSAVRGQETKVQVFIDGVEQKQAKVKVKQSAAQRRGPVPGRS